jgi:hypothetical protein
MISGPHEAIMAISDILEEELALYQKLVGEQASNAPGADQAAKFDLDEVVSLGLFVIERIRERNRALSEAGFAANLAVMPDEESHYLVRLYQAWLGETTKLVETLRVLEGRGIASPRVDELKEAYRDVRLMNFDIDRIKQSIMDAIEGRGKPLREAADEFRRRRYGQSA